MSTDEQRRVGPIHGKRSLRWLIRLGLPLACVGGLLVLLAGPGYRWQLWGLTSAFTLLRWGAFIGLGGAVASLLALATAIAAPGRHSAQALLGCLGMAIGGAGFAVPWMLLQQAHRVPPIHDITTDTVNPPAFQAILPLRRDAPNPAAYAGPGVARQQRQAYPDIQPLRLQARPPQVFAAARRVAREMGWQIVAAVPEQGRIEATATTSWFGFKDDVVIRIRPTEEGTRLDIRSVSRIGVSDLGQNADRIRRFRLRLERSLAR